MDNRKQYLDDVAIKLSIKTSSDWGRVTTKQINELGGGTLLSGYYKGSLFSCLRSVYKG